jgi:hypothetical protein
MKLLILISLLGLCSCLGNSSKGSSSGSVTSGNSTANPQRAYVQSIQSQIPANLQSNKTHVRRLQLFKEIIKTVLLAVVATILLSFLVACIIKLLNVTPNKTIVDWFNYLFAEKILSLSIAVLFITTGNFIFVKGYWFVPVKKVSEVRFYILLTLSFTVGILFLILLQKFGINT